MHDNPGGVDNPGEPGAVVGSDEGDQFGHQSRPAPRRAGVVVTGKDGPAI